jgi:hypothetical protein
MKTLSHSIPYFVYFWVVGESDYNLRGSRPSYGFLTPIYVHDLRECSIRFTYDVRSLWISEFSFFKDRSCVDCKMFSRITFPGWLRVPILVVKMSF